LKIIAQYL